MSFIIVGLGNPGEEYQETRHNAGRIIVEELKKLGDFSDWEKDKKTNALLSKGEFEKEKVVLLMPETFMNRSGESLRPLVSSEKKAEKIIVVYDDLDLPLGISKIAFNRGSGGHRGIENIIKSLKTEKFIRIRIGISPKKKIPSERVEKHILGQFKKEEKQILKEHGKKIAEILPVLFSEGLPKAMTLFNK